MGLCRVAAHRGRALLFSFSVGMGKCALGAQGSVETCVAEFPGLRGPQDSGFFRWCGGIRVNNAGVYTFPPLVFLGVKSCEA